MAINEIICLPIYLFFPGVIIMYVTGILEKIVKELWQNTFVPCTYKCFTAEDSRALGSRIYAFPLRK